jgi:ADP-ribose pyrophosphatase
MHDDELLETTVERRVIHTGRYLTFRQDTIADARGRHHSRDWVEHPGAVAVLAIDGGDVLMVRQYRTPAARVLLEIPAGTLDRDPTGTIEDPDLAAPRELGEETGYRAASWRRLGSFFPAPGFASEFMHLYLATDLAPIEGYAGPEPDERIAIQRIPVAQAIALADSGAIEDAKTLLGLFWLERLVARGELAI